MTDKQRAESMRSEFMAKHPNHCAEAPAMLNKHELPEVRQWLSAPMGAMCVAADAEMGERCDTGDGFWTITEIIRRMPWRGITPALIRHASELQARIMAARD